MVAHFAGDSVRFESPLQGKTLLVRHADRSMSAGPARLVKGEAGVADVGHNRMSFGPDDPGGEDTLVERRRGVRILRFDGDVVDAWHGCHECPTSR